MKIRSNRAISRKFGEIQFNAIYTYFLVQSLNQSYMIDVSWIKKVIYTYIFAIKFINKGHRSQHKAKSVKIIQSKSFSTSFHLDSLLMMVKKTRCITIVNYLQKPRGTIISLCTTDELWGLSTDDLHPERESYVFNRLSTQEDMAWHVRERKLLLE